MEIINYIQNDKAHIKFESLYIHVCIMYPSLIAMLCYVTLRS